jgi:hypothetical protein
MDRTGHTLRPILNVSVHTTSHSGKACAKKVATNHLLAAESDVATKNGLPEQLPLHDLKRLAPRVRSADLADLPSVEIKSKLRTSQPMMTQTSPGPKVLQHRFHLNHFQLKPKART